MIQILTTTITTLLYLFIIHLLLEFIIQLLSYNLLVITKIINR